jgi:hypothetical protein
LDDLLTILNEDAPLCLMAVQPITPLTTSLYLSYTSKLKPMIVTFVTPVGDRIGER